MALYHQFGGRGYPGFFVEAGSAHRVQIRGIFTRHGQRWQLTTAEQFVALLKRQVAQR
jgi:hypothetical protein